MHTLFVEPDLAKVLLGGKYRTVRGEPAPPPGWRIHTLDSIYKQEPVGFVHLDIEGGEEDALHGGRRA